MQESNNLESTPQLSTGRRRDYIPSAHPGSRLPHMYVRLNKFNEVCININTSFGPRYKIYLTNLGRLSKLVNCQKCVLASLKFLS